MGQVRNWRENAYKRKKIGGKIRICGKMTRRRLRVIDSSSEDDDGGVVQQPQYQQEEHMRHEQEEDDIEVELEESTLNLETVTLNTPNPNPNPNPYPNPSLPVQLEISDDDEEFIDVQLEISDDDEEFIDVTENLSPPPPPPVTDQSFHSSFASSFCSNSNNFAEDSDFPISGFLARLGLRLRREWLDSCVRGLESSVQGFGSLDLAGKAKLCFEQFLRSDMNFSGAGILPENVHDMDLVDLPGPYVLQVDEIVNLSCPLKGRYQSAPAGLKRCLKLSMTDGVQRVFGMEYRPVKDLEVLAPAGMKVAICNVNIRRGLLMLVPEDFEVLGGVVEDLEAARQRLVQEVNKPPRGKRTRTGMVPPLATRATGAAWPSDSVGAPGHTNTPIPQAAAPPYAAEQGRASGISTRERTTEGFAIPTRRGNAEPNPTFTSVPDDNEIHMVDPVDHQDIRTGDNDMSFTYLSCLWATLAEMMDKSLNVKGKIKCFMTGVKGFQFKHRATFELCVYVDDGSMISEILIDHKVVQSGIGHSPKEVTAALTSSDTKRVSDMRETLKQFQVFLANFEGCPTSYAWLLLRRLQSSNTAQPQQPSHLNPINLSP
ncbi:recQ-mediated genome instability protein 1 isoform X2 [Rhododendron vialii]|uniref:recQ-mediated genome instability protein 1 isoform X2 n=1 Tax=Rhododendron vialii TaxID=182163 RepID=UPI00265D9A5E|nr:recQ-mediated genome instability protein 1 isoform X2 [Rhododendron vialii]